MVRKFISAIAATATLGAALSPTGVLAARWGGGHGGGFATPHFSQGWGRGDIRADRRDLRADRFDIRRDRPHPFRDPRDGRVGRLDPPSGQPALPPRLRFVT